MLTKSIIQQNTKELQKIHAWRKLHQSLARKYGTKENHFSHKKVGFIRHAFFFKRYDRKKTIKWVEEIMYRPHQKRTHKISWYLHLYNFLKNCTEEIWNDIIQPLEIEK